jgi:hypothetical protein
VRAVACRELALQVDGERDEDAGGDSTEQILT